MKLKYLKKSPFSWTVAGLAATSYGGFMFDFVMSSAIGSYIGFSALGLTGIGIIGGLTYFQMNKEKIETKEKEDEYISLKKEINRDYSHLNINNIFNKVETVKGLLAESTSNTGMFYLRMLGLVNHSLELYLENLKIISKYEKVLEIDNSELYKDEINKNEIQNKELISKIDYFIQEFLHNQNNDSKMDNVLSEYEKNVRIYDEIQSIRKNS